MRRIMELWMLLACLFVAGPLWSQTDDGPVRIRVFAHYVSWYTQQQPGVHDHQWSESSLFPIPPHRGSGVGEGYSSRDPKIIALQNEDFIEYGITPLASWAGPGYFAGDDFYDAYLAVPSSVQIGTLYEMTILLKSSSEGTQEVFDFDDPENAAKFVADIRYLKSRYYDRFPQRFVKIDGKPVVFLWVTGLIRGDFEKAVASIRDDVFLIGSEVSPYPPGNGTLARLPVIRGLDAISGYGSHFEDFHDGSGRLSPQYVGQQIAGYRLWSQWLSVHAPDVIIIPPFSFSANDTGIPERAPHSRPYFSSKAEASYAARQYWEFLSKIYDGCEVRNIPPMVNITSYNEIIEGTSMEATRRNPDIPQPFPEDFGHRYLEVVRDVLRQPIAYTERRCPQ